MRDSCIKGYEWPLEFAEYKSVLSSLEGKMDFDKFLRLLRSYEKSESVVITLLSKEYLNIGKVWLRTLKQAEIKQYIVIAVDNDTANFLDSVNVPNCRIKLNGIKNISKAFKSRTGFTSKGLAITTLKYPIVKLILESGYNVLLMDIDALLLKPFPVEYFKDMDIVFQRVVYFPETIAKVWGFSACSGFVWFNANNNTISIVDIAIEVQKITYDDQIALNVALWDCDINWEKSQTEIINNVNNELDKRNKIFNNHSNKHIDGIGSNPVIKIRALSPRLFWRNDIVKLDLSETILFHPNSLKEEKSKLSVYDKFKLNFKNIS